MQIPTRLALLLFAVLATTASSDTATLSTTTSALDAYEWGFAFDVMRASDGVVLNDLVLIENDGPGSGHSEKGTFIENIHDGVRAKKILELPNATAEEAHVILYMEPQGMPDPPPYYLFVNGHRVDGNPIPWHDRQWHWVEVPVEYLREGPNEIVVASDAPADEGYHLLVARADEYSDGGGAYTYQGNTALVSANQITVPIDAVDRDFVPIDVGAHSAKSVDDGRSWTKHALGTSSDVTGEYVIRLNLKQRKPQGFLRSRAIDLWDGIDGMGSIAPRCAVRDVVFDGRGDTPDDTNILWSVRFADSPDMESDAWGEFVPVGAGAEVSVPVDSGGKRYVQWQAQLETSNPLATPVVREAVVTRTLDYTPPPVHTFYVQDYDNPTLRYSTIRFDYEDSEIPQLEELRERLNLDQVVDGARSDFDRVNRLRYFVSKLWYHGDPLPEYPEWNALEILDRRDKYGAGGMCIQFTITFIQCLQALGYQARHVNIFNHESVEVYVDDLGKWVHVDPESVFDSYEFNTETGTPVSMLEQHRHFLNKYGLTAENPIPWMSTEPWCNHPNAGLPENTPPLEISTYTAWLNDPDPAKRPPQHNLVGFMRMMPRNNYFSQPTPRPLTQGCTWWPWDGYLNWYDNATPRKLQYALHTDRVSDFYPTLNQVAFDAVYGEKEGDIDIALTSITPNFDTYEINVDDTGWTPAKPAFTWTLRRSAVNTLEMRTRNTLGVTGKPSGLAILYHYREPFRPKDQVANH